MKIFVRVSSKLYYEEFASKILKPKLIRQNSGITLKISTREENILQFKGTKIRKIRLEKKFERRARKFLSRLSLWRKVGV